MASWNSPTPAMKSNDLPFCSCASEKGPYVLSIRAILPPTCGMEWNRGDHFGPLISVDGAIITTDGNKDLIWYKAGPGRNTIVTI